jgi:hypothetical protein
MVLSKRFPKALRSHKIDTLQLVYKNAYAKNYTEKVPCLELHKQNRIKALEKQMNSNSKIKGISYWLGF